MTDTREFWRGAAAGVLLMAGIAVGLLQMQEGRATTSFVAGDRRADSLQARLDSAEARSAADSSEKERLAAAADSAAAIARAALRRPRTVFVTRPDTATPAVGDTVKRALIMRAVDPAPFSVPQFLVDAIEEQDRKFAYVMSAWQDSEKARLFADSVYIPDLRRQLAESGEVIRAERTRIADRDRAIAGLERELAIRRRFGFKEGAAAGAAIVTILLLGR